MMTSRSDSGVIGFCLAIMVTIGLAFNIAAIVVAVENADDPCQGNDKSHVSLHGWLLVSGIVGLGVTVIQALSMLGVIAFDWENCFIFGAATTVLNSFFVLAWFIVGIVVVARSNSSCVDDSTSLGVMSVIMLVLEGLAVWGMCCTKSTSQ